MIQNEHDTYSSSVMIIKGCMLFLYSTIAVLSIYYRVQYDNILRRVSSRTRKPDRNGERLNIERTQFLLSTFYVPTQSIPIVSGRQDELFAVTVKEVCCLAMGSTDPHPPRNKFVFLYIPLGLSFVDTQFTVHRWMLLLKKVARTCSRPSRTV